MKKLILITFAVTTILLGGCGTVYDTVVTIKDVGDSIQKEYARLYNDGMITPEQSTQAEKITARYRQAMGVLGDVLQASKSGQGDVPSALRAAKEAIQPLLDIIVLHANPARVETLSKQLNSAKAQ